MDLLVILALFLGALFVGAAAGARGRSAGGWFLLSLFVTPFLTVLLVLCLPNLAAIARQKAQHDELLQALRAASAGVPVPDVIDVAHRDVSPPPPPAAPNKPEGVAGVVIMVGILIGFVALIIWAGGTIQ
jgi:Flp pilus assembly protein TadB